MPWTTFYPCWLQEARHQILCSRKAIWQAGAWEEWISPAWQEFSQRRSAAMPWLQDPLRRRIRDFQWVLNAYYPTATDITMGRLKRAALRAVSAWRYHLRFYSRPLELRALHKVMAYQRPETSGF